MIGVFDDLSDDELIARLVQRGVGSIAATFMVVHYRDGCDVCVPSVDERLS